MSPRDTRPDEDVALDLAPADDTALADAGLPTEGGQDGAPAPTGAGSARRPERRGSPPHRPYNGAGRVHADRDSQQNLPNPTGVLLVRPPADYFLRVHIAPALARRH